jgi:hypothetical protein
MACSGSGSARSSCRHGCRLLILIAAPFSSRLSRYTRVTSKPVPAQSAESLFGDALKPPRQHRPTADLGFCLLAKAALDELSSLPPDLIQRGPELGPSFVNFMELPPRFARSERDEEPAAQAGHLRMIAKPTDGLLVCLAAARAGNLDLGIIERAFGHDASPHDGFQRMV